MGSSGIKTSEIVDELSDLKSCINDLVGVLALPPLWCNSGPKEIVYSLLEVLLRTLHIDFLSAKLTFTNASIEKLQLACSASSKSDELALQKTLEVWLTDKPQTRSPVIRWPTKGDRCRIVVFRIGSSEHLGDIIAGSLRADFPTKTERLILSVAANQAAVALQGARYREEQLQLAKDQALRLSKRNSQLVELQARYALLTPREREVLPFVVAGWLSKQIAAKLGTSEITIRVHRGQIMRKMQAQSLAALIKMATILGTQ